MAYDTFAAVLNTSEFPFISNFLQRTITIPGIDLPPRAGKVVTGTEEGSNKELPQGFYCQNVLPTSEGLQSVSYAQIVPALVPNEDFDQVITLRDVDENNFLFAPAKGKNYIFRGDVGFWASKNPFVGWLGDIVSRSYVNGRTFIQYEKYKMFEYNTGADTFDEKLLIGINASDIDCIGAAQNYNIAIIGINVHWSSLIDPLDFVPSINTGAGTAVPQDMKGIGRAVVPIAGGFVIYTTRNAVAALYTNNARAPFVFKEISNAGGLISPQHVSLEASLGFHYAYTTNGLQKISINSAETLSSAASDFLAGRILETFDLSTLTFTLERLSMDLEVHVNYVSGRWLIISYGKKVIGALQEFTHALVLDVALKRWGKLRIDHVDAFSYPYPTSIGEISQIPPKQALAFLKKTGQVDLCIMDYRLRADQGVLLLGKYQLVRQKTITFQTFELEGLQTGTPPEVYIAVSIDGSLNASFEALEIIKDNGDSKIYGAPAPISGGRARQRTGKNFSALIKGTFELSTGILTVTRHGNR